MRAFRSCSCGCDLATRPAPQQLQGKPLETRYYWSRFDELVLVEGVLYINSYGENGDATGTRLVVPRAMRPEVLRACHDEQTGGLLGVAKTLNKRTQDCTGQK